MKAVLIAAGKGERLEPLTLTRPKCLIPVAGSPLIEHHLQSLSKLGIREIGVVVNYKEKQVRDFLGDGSKYGVRIEYARQKELDGTAHGLGAAKQLVGDENFLAVYADLLTDLSSLRILKESFLRGRADGAMAVTRVQNASAYGVVAVRKGRVTRITEKPPRRSASGLINAGMYGFKPEIFDYISKTKPNPKRGEYELTTSIQMMIDDGLKVIAEEIPSKEWIDIGRPWDLLDANRQWLSQIKPLHLGMIEDGCHLIGSVRVEKSARIRSGAYIEGPCLIDEGADIGPNCYLRPATYIGRHARIGNAVEIKNSIVLNQTHIGHLSYVGDSVIGEGCNLGAGTITANLRLDDAIVKMRVKGEAVETGRRKLGTVLGDGVKTGINVSIMPGVKVGPGAWIAAHISVERDLGAKEFLRGQDISKKKISRIQPKK
jgi:UDP-N-acetylglucosamine diphosphorylase / glucose-1-phosphate thymidylyltransferase / UDP-N-acetylgalactosamine diphosphorylase / glucosamine-1-phosphate N-acetyltransferase / galactosamine-1-phosphate N-acetyltransferase